MTRHKGASSKQAVTAADLAEIVDCYRRLQRIYAGLNWQSDQKMPLMAATTTVKACWAELSGKASAWTYPDTGVQKLDPDLVIPPSGPMQPLGRG